ncbi:MAG: hypothetical protein JXB48_04270 [Candidatus Latescibacteria bacterium]|nr:hypothetical protein [Candidatus Latescibacterota bacterium]
MNIIFLVILKLGIDFVVYAWFFGILAGTLWAFISIISHYGFYWKPSWKIFTISGSFGYKACIAVAGMFVMVNIHTFVLGPISGKTGDGLAMVAIFSVCFRFFQLLQRVSNVSGTILFSHVVQENKKTGFIRTMKVTRNIILFSTVLSLVGLLIGKSIIRLISNSTYDMAYIPLIIMLPGIITVNAASVINGMYWGHGYPYKVIIAPFLITIIGFVMDMVFVPVIGVSGASLSFTAMSLMWFLYLVFIFHKDSGLKLHEIILPRKEDIFLISSKIKNAFWGADK